MEPERADYQRDLSGALARVGMADDQAAGDHLRRALAILTSLKDAGRLDKVDEPKIADLQRMLNEAASEERAS